MKTTFKYDHYAAYAELKNDLEYFAQKYPELTSLDVNMVTPEGRNQYVLTITNKKTGAALDKPALYIDGNIHAGEVTSTECALYTADVLLSNYGEDKEITKLVDQKTFYIIPRVSPDGAEKYLTTPYSLRSAPRTWKEEKGGIVSEDLDHDGVIRMMRIPTKYGAWKKDPQNANLMTLRAPDDTEGEFYDIYPEGVLEQYEGDENLRTKKAVWGLDFNRNFPYGWFGEPRQSGAGDYPLSNPENKAIIDFVLAHPNIGGAAIGHTSGGLLLYPPGTRHAKTAPSADIQSMKEIADIGAKLLGYKPMNIFDSFMSDQVNYDSGALDDWFYQSQGIPAYTMEFWDVNTKAGKPYQWGKEEERSAGIERFNAVMKWVKENAPEYYLDWQPFNHPVFGKVEIGGFNFKYTIQNPPQKFLENECRNDALFNIAFARALPQLEIADIQAEKEGEDLYKVTAVIGNPAYLPTNLTDEAVHLKTNAPVKVKLSGVTLLAGKEESAIGDLSGYSRTETGAFYGNFTTFSNAKAKKKLTWLVKGKQGDQVTVSAWSAKAGKTEKTITL